MPIECALLENDPPPFEACPECSASPFVPFLRGTCQRSERAWFGLGDYRPYCAVICESCKNIVGYEMPAVYKQLGPTQRSFAVLWVLVIAAVYVGAAVYFSVWRK